MNTLSIPVNFASSRALHRALGLAAACAAFSAHPVVSCASGALQPVPARAGSLAIVDGKFAHTTRIEEGTGISDYLPREVQGPFSSVSLEMDAHVVLLRGKTPAVRVDAQPNIQKYIEVRQVGTQLYIAATGSYSTRNPVTVEITAPSLEELDVTGDGNVDIQGNFGRALHVATEGHWAVSGKGQVDSLDLTLTDAEVTLAQFSVRDVILHGGSSSRVTLRATSSVSGALSGHPNVTVWGHPARQELKLGHGDTVHFPR